MKENKDEVIRNLRKRETLYLVVIGGMAILLIMAVFGFIPFT